VTVFGIIVRQWGQKRLEEEILNATMIAPMTSAAIIM
jgi:hypothetical protein